MLVLLSFLMVLVATVLLVLGLLVSGDGLTLIYVSIGMSAVAAILLIIAVRSSKPAHDQAAGPSPLEPEPERERELVGAGARARSSESTATMPAVPPTDLASAPAAAVPMTPPPVDAAPPAASDPAGEWLASDSEWGDEPPGEWDANGEVDFPIADYDDLTVAEVLPLLPQLYSDELDVVEAREREGLNRREVLDTLARLRITGTDADREVATEEEAAEADGGGWEEEPVAAVDDSSPIPGYDAMPVSEIVASLAGLDDAALDAVRAHEAATKNRRTVLAAIDRRLGVTSAAAPAPAPAPAPTRKAVAAKKATAPAAKKRSAGATSIKKAAAKKKAAPAAKKAVTKKAAAAKKAAAPVAKKKAAAAKKAAAKKRS